MIRILFAASSKDWAGYEKPLTDALTKTGLSFALVTEAEPETVDYIVYAPSSSLQDFTPYTRLKAVLNLWAGVENVVGNHSLKVPLTRMVDSGMTEGMVEWCVGHVMRYHLGLDADICRTDTEWEPRVPPLARERRVAVLGLGALGSAVATALTQLKFDVAGWSRSLKSIQGVQTFHNDAGLSDAISRAEILVLLLPLTEATQNILNASRFAEMKSGVCIINPGRGPLIDDDALLHALDTGKVAQATLDVFREEPLPKDHPFWAHPRVTVSPHIASATRQSTASQVIAENIRRGEAGEPLLHVVDRSAGY